MQIDKQQILQFLIEQGKRDEAAKAKKHLPDQVDTDQHAGLLAQHGIDVPSLLSKFGGGSLGGLLG
jgi:hypothetical protein